MNSPEALCHPCMRTLGNNDASRCLTCGLGFNASPGASAVCGQCLRDPPAFDDTTVVTDYAAPIDALVQDLKFRARLPLARMFGHLLIHAASPSLQQADVLLPVPLSQHRLEQRGFNQALEIARPLARAWKMPLSLGGCVRTKDTSPQAELPLSARRVNMRGAFAVRDRKAIENRHVLVIDDVMTTGHTLRELAACLKRHGAARVSNLVLARTPTR